MLQQLLFTEHFILMLLLIKTINWKHKDAFWKTFIECVASDVSSSEEILASRLTVHQHTTGKQTKYFRATGSEASSSCNTVCHHLMLLTLCLISCLFIIFSKSTHMHFSHKTLTIKFGFRSYLVCYLNKTTLNTIISDVTQNYFCNFIRVFSLWINEEVLVLKMFMFWRMCSYKMYRNLKS